MKKVIFTILFLHVIICCYAQTIDEYLKAAVSKDSLHDFKAAIADYTKVIEIDSACAIAYIYRGTAKDSLYDFIGAIADYTKAIEMDSTR